MADKFTILLVDDSPLIRRLVREMLRLLGQPRVIEAADGAEALAALSRHPVDLVLSDWNMLPMDGLSLLQAMRAVPAWAATPFILMTGEQTPQSIAEAIAVGISGYLTKPFCRDQLNRVLLRTEQWPLSAGAA